jgi:hypothetical protein
LRRFGRRQVIITAITLAAVLLVTVGALFGVGIFHPFARVITLAELPAPQANAAYAHVAVDAKGYVWVAQSAPGLASNPADPTVLTIVNPDQFLGDKVQARICLGCAGIQTVQANNPGPVLARIDDIAPDPTAPHSVYVAGWTAPPTSLPMVVHLAWHVGTASCTVKHPCATEQSVLTPDTTIGLIGKPLHPNIPLLRQLLAIGVAPVLTLTTAPNGDLFCFLSDRGKDSLNDPVYNVVGGFQTLLRLPEATKQWAEAYVGPGGSRAAQHVSPTSTIDAIAVDRAERYLYLADADHQAIFRLDLRDPNLASPNVYLAAGTVTRWAGQPLAATAFGDMAQGVPGWSGDGDAALDARLNLPRGLAFDAAGDLLVSDAGNARVRLITPQGRIWTVAGRGAPTVDGDSGMPLASGLRGLLGIAADAKGRVYVIQGAARDRSGHVALRQVDWGWFAPHNGVGRVTLGGQGFAGEVTAGLAAQNDQAATALLLSASGCPQADTGCATRYALAEGGVAPGQVPLVLPQVATNATMTTADPVAAVHVPGTQIIATVSASADVLTFVGTTPDCCAGIALPTIALPEGAEPTGLAALVPVTDAQVARLGATYLLVATQGGPNGSALLIYQAAPQTCVTNQRTNCQNFPGTPTLAATLPLTGQSTGAVAVALSDDATHAFALIAQPAEHLVSVVDLSAWLAHSTPLSVTGQLTVPAPTGAMVLRNDGQAAYVGAGGGQLAVLNTAGWLNAGVPTNLTGAAVTLVALGAANTQTAQLALTGDDTHLFAALQTSVGATTIVTLAVGQFAAPAAPTLLSHFSSEARLVALTLAAHDTRLLAVAAPTGPGHAGALHTWVTADPADPTQWLATPLSLGTIATPDDPRALVG